MDAGELAVGVGEFVSDRPLGLRPAPVTGLRIGSPRISSTPSTWARAARPSMSSSNSMSAKMGSYNLSQVEENTLNTVAKGSVSSPRKIRNSASRCAGVARRSMM
jgi:hypothetical protein